jgi:hypothetical protein
MDFLSASIDCCVEEAMTNLTSNVSAVEDERQERAGIEF